MSFVTFVSGRYLRTRQKRAFISLITALSVAGVTVGVMALIVVIAVMAGFEADLKSRIMGIRPHLVITQKEGALTDYHRIVEKVADIQGVETASAYIATQVVLRTANRAAGALLKGIVPTSGNTGIPGVDTGSLLPPSSAEKDPQADLRPAPGIVLGKQLAASLGVIRGDSIHMITPRGMLSPAGHIPAMIKYKVVDLFESGMYEFDGSLSFVTLEQAQKMLRMPASVSGIEIRLENLDRADRLQEEIQQLVGSDYNVENWKQINRNLFSALRLEKTVMFIILALIVLVAAFNIAGSLVMMVMEKRRDIAILKTMGATAKSIGRIFVVKGVMIGLAGTALGTSAGLILCTLLERYQFIKLPADVYYITSLPVHLKAMDVFTIALCAILICLAATLYPARQAAAIDPVEAIRHG
ncbi:lipoprotein-releasing ABC transporter permease subunit [uncultured Desulfosarcina sp.]|uniref:lipoprotein-releasing ABC transporter permease subunit n=1 Tax=uncultured Desulfosarcina sp. TaxID=218289 RepID=UPI0029C7B80B|nr:lipoprotein-releasing ABC transporter permease subunit [uncultured Desulfosarcina sp.]